MRHILNYKNRRDKVELLKAVDKGAMTAFEAFGAPNEIIMIRVQQTQNPKDDFVEYRRLNNMEKVTLPDYELWMKKNPGKSTGPIIFK